MASTVEIVNRALQHIGVARIADLDEAGKAAREAKAAWDGVRRATLAGHPWNFAIVRTSLAASATAPAWGYAAAYPVPVGPDPAACLRVLEVDGEGDGETGDPWRLETVQGVGLAIVTDLGAPLYVRYVGDVSNAAQLAPAFAELLALDLALALQPTLAPSRVDIDRLKAARKEALQDARFVDGAEGSRELVIADEWLEARY